MSLHCPLTQSTDRRICTDISVQLCVGAGDISLCTIEMMVPNEANRSPCLVGLSLPLPRAIANQRRVASEADSVRLSKVPSVRVCWLLTMWPQLASQMGYFVYLVARSIGPINVLCSGHCSSQIFTLPPWRQLPTVPIASRNGDNY